MKNYEFRNHLKVIQKILIKSKNNRLILVNQEYSDIQQRKIDSICSVNLQIVGQIKRTSENFDVTQEITNLVNADKEPFIHKDELSYVIMGQIRSKNSDEDQLHV